MKKYIIKNIERPDPRIIGDFKRFDVSTVYEAQGKRGLMNYELKPVIPGASICGPAVTVVCQAGDNLMIHAAIEVCQPGDILVITTIGESISGMIGELIVTALIKKGVQGVIISAGIRDAAQIRQLGFPIWSKAIYSEGTTKVKAGWVNAPAICGGIEVKPGDLIMADDDGVVLVKKDEVEEVYHRADKRVLKEEGTKKKIANGELSLDFYNLRETLAKENVMYYDNKEEMEKGYQKV
ncbi:4-carboxy-4-hydroxy-2-oxoadipate aldolase/oxaloacetate decarboxylase [Neobacillus vireti]|uniref:Putative 4-hydroxy-4-methyl-2-oxoglutarate aldolase n=1 Tax=Neobacillus vireti LMG 21834 TaxID=1131730 RepID=A0AB94ISA4_9BACI|nr:4-carboxy-4-hydroxy-2-oxoadipate aldolase/oxaloacetate decarboxylase [Neobacillus vireti]ETI69951.1 dimethylmenaquinone methyltransferase [Neobacillus vireti LMG 21834]KLT18016.1 hypothetical protein AA980_10050 [Neobacillus vireti]